MRGVSGSQSVRGSMQLFAIRVSQHSTARMILLLSLLGVGLASGGLVYPVPDPYRWDESFVVQQPQLDGEHRELFNGLLLVESDNNPGNLAAAKVQYHDHFSLEESLFCQTMSESYTADHKGKHKTFLARFDGWVTPVPASELTWAKNWLVQHIKNKDFKYVGSMPHPVSKPYDWNESFEVFYARLDEEHKILFDHIRELGNNPRSIS